MLDSINNSILTTIQPYMPSSDKIAKSAKTMLVAAIALEALAQIPGADGGPVTYALCIAGCAFSTPVALPFCLAACSISTGPWCP
jgi:hypothetical protein